MIFDSTPIKQRLETSIVDSVSTSTTPFALIIVLIGDDKASVTYTHMKKRKGACLGIDVYIITPKDTYESIDTAIEQKAREIRKSNPHTTIGLIFQLPIQTKGLWHTLYRSDIWKKHNLIDVDMLGIKQKYTLFDQGYYPPTVASIIKVMKSSGINSFEGVSVAIIGQGELVGFPCAYTLMRKGATVHSLNEYSPPFETLASSCDIIISGAGKPGLITQKHINKHGQLLIDASTSSDKGVLVGDFDLERIISYIDQEKLDEVVHICKSPGGIGPLTVLSLFHNLITLPLV